MDSTFPIRTKISTASLTVKNKNGTSLISNQYSTYPIKFVNTANFTGSSCAQVLALGYGGGIVSG
jgi:urease accessory protein UreH